MTKPEANITIPVDLTNPGQFFACCGLLELADRRWPDAECARRGLPRPEIAVLDWDAQPGTGLHGRVRLTFNQAVTGPIILGRTRHVGGGVFTAADPASGQQP